jgi:pimeloyl-ACP methyl ester carboxylesterase
MASLPKPDRAILACPEVQRAFLETVREALRNGPRGARLDTALMGSPWDFSPRDIGVEVHLWHGEADRNASPAMGRYLADVIPDSQPKFYPDEGHLSLIFKHAEEILGVLAS